MAPSPSSTPKTQQRFDAIVVGLGVHGAAILRALAKAGLVVAGFDAFLPPHGRGSSHGRTRIIRQAYWEHPSYVPLAKRAEALWIELERETGKRLYTKTGALFMGPPKGQIVSGATRAATLHKLPHQSLDAETLHAKYPQFAPTADMEGVHEPNAGFLAVEACVTALLDGAKKAGAQVHVDTPVLDWRPSLAGFEVVTQDGTYQCKRVVLAAGPWMAKLVKCWIPWRVERQTVHWFRPAAGDERFDPKTCPVFGFEAEPGKLFYGIPDEGHGVKVAWHHGGATVDPATADLRATPKEVAKAKAAVATLLPGLEKGYASSEVCLYTNTPDEHFLIDRHPDHVGVTLVSPCSGHGFKFATVVGEIVAEEVQGKPSGFDMDLFRLSPKRWPGLPSPR